MSAANTPLLEATTAIEMAPFSNAVFKRDFMYPSLKVIAKIRYSNDTWGI
jgi:hypothetical protein